MLRRLWPILIGAIILTGLNACKPLHIDDTTVALAARHYAQHPLDPLGFTMFWWDLPESANDVLLPPVLPAYVALECSLFGENVVAWKLGLFPWALLLAVALDRLLRRFVVGGHDSLLLLMLISPGLLTSFNLYLDVPALALGLSALSAFMAAADRSSLVGTALAGLIAGLALQTKYTAFTIPPAILLYSWCSGRWREGIAACLVAGQVFVFWEALTSLLYGTSHFLAALPRGQRGSYLTKLRLMPFLVSYLGGLSPAILALGLTALGAGWRTLLVFALLTLAGFAIIGIFDIDVISYLDVPPVLVEFAEMFCLALGAALLGVAVVVAVVLFRRSRRWPALNSQRRQTLFLISWLALEVAAYPALTPFPAARRVLGVGVVVTLLLARARSRCCAPRAALDCYP